MFLFSAALGAAIRFQTTDRARAIEEVKLRQRNELARELHDAVGHHLSGIAVQAQAGRALGGSRSHPGASRARDDRADGIAGAGGDARDGGRPT